MEANFNTIKDFVEKRIKDAEKYANSYQEVMNTRAIAFGAILFSDKCGIAPFEEIQEYWEGYAWNKFEEIAKSKRR